MSRMTPCQWLVVMVKAAYAGRVKTRLARDIGAVNAAAFYRHATRAVVGRLADTGRWQTVLAVTPDTSLASPLFPDGPARIAQGTGNLGERMQRVMDGLPPGRVVIIGSDCLAVTSNAIATAFAALGAHDAVVGPAHDGGYWLVGLRRTPKCPAVFHNVRWSSEHALADTIANMNGLRVARLQTLTDVDTGPDFLELGDQLGRRILPL